MLFSENPRNQKVAESIFAVVISKSALRDDEDCAGEDI